MKTYMFNYLTVICIGISLGQVQAETAELDHVSHQIDALKLSNENLQLCFERYQHDVERNFNKIVAQQEDNQNQLEQLFGSMTKHSKSEAVTHVLLEFLSNKENSKICVRSIDQTLVCVIVAMAAKPKIYFDSIPLDIWLLENFSTAVVYPTSCAEYDAHLCANGKCRIQNMIYGSESFLVSCDDTTDGGGWTVIQRRINGAVEFYRGWSEYKKGFGNVDGEFWIGLDKLHALTKTLAPVELLIQLKDHNDTLKYAKFGKFSIGSESEMYKLTEADGYDGNAGDSFSLHKGYKFTTKDKDNDDSPTANCAIDKRGAWWYKACGWANLNGVYHNTAEFLRNNTQRGIYWYDFHGYDYSLKFVQMMIRPRKA